MCASLLRRASGNKLAKGLLFELCKIFDVKVIFAGFFSCAFTECIH